MKNVNWRIAEGFCFPGLLISRLSFLEVWYLTSWKGLLFPRLLFPGRLMFPGLLFPGHLIPRGFLFPKLLFPKGLLFPGGLSFPWHSVEFNSTLFIVDSFYYFLRHISSWFLQTNEEKLCNYAFFAQLLKCVVRR